MVLKSFSEIVFRNLRPQSMSQPPHSRRSPITIRDVARKAGTSPATVSRVLTGSANVRPEKREAVLRAIEELNYTPNLLARGLKTQRTQTLGVIINNIQDVFYSTVAKGIQDYATGNSYLILIADTTDDPERERKMLQLMRDKSVDGIIFAPLGGNQDLVEELQEEGIALMAVDRTLEGIDLPTVLVDNRKGAEDAVMHLIGQGFERIALINSQKPITTYQDREAGYRSAFERTGRQVDERMVMRGGPRLADGREMALALMQQRPRPDAIFVASGSLALGAMAALQELGLSVPDDLGVAVFDDFDYFRIFSPTLTAVRQPAYQLGQTAAALLLGAIREEKPLPPSPTILPVELMVRESSQKRR